jgi:hypothetical protein
MKSHKLDIPLISNQQQAVRLFLPYPMTETDWEFMHDVLQAMKPGIVNDKNGLFTHGEASQ